MFYTIENEKISITVSDLGATLIRFIEKETNTDIVLGYDTEEEYTSQGGTLGASVGRNANRIKNAEFTLNGTTYHLAKNNNENNLHGGGKNGFGFRRWTMVDQTEDKLVFSYYSMDGEEGFPGNLFAKVTYSLDGNTMTQTFEGSSDKDTVFNMTSHSYFNLGDENNLNEELYITTDKYAPVDEFSMTLDEVRDVKGTPYDFTTFTKIGENTSKLPSGIDNNYVWEVMGDKLICQLRNEKLLLSVYSDMPDMHLYTGYGLTERKGKYGQTYNRSHGTALECQYFPNAVNFTNYISPVLPAGETRKNYIRYVIEKR